MISYFLKQPIETGKIGNRTFNSCFRSGGGWIFFNIEYLSISYDFRTRIQDLKFSKRVPTPLPLFPRTPNLDPRTILATACTDLLYLK